MRGASRMRLSSVRTLHKYCGSSVSWFIDTSSVRRLCISHIESGILFSLLPEILQHNSNV